MYRVMAVDDEIWVLRGLKKLIPWEHYGFELASAFTDPVAAVKAFCQTPADVVFVDVSMARMDGFTLIQKMRERSEETQFVILSAYSEFDYAKRAIALQVVDYLVKPITKEMLVSMLEKLRARLERTRISAKRSKLYQWLMQSDSVMNAESLRLLTGIAWNPGMEMVVVAWLGENGEAALPEPSVASYPFQSPDGACEFRICAAASERMNAYLSNLAQSVRPTRQIVGCSEVFLQVEACALAMRQAWQGAQHGFFRGNAGLFRGAPAAAAAGDVEMIARLAENGAWKAAVHELKRLADSALDNWTISDALRLYQRVTTTLNAAGARLQSIYSEEALLSVYHRFSDLCMFLGAALLECAGADGAVEIVAVENYLRHNFNALELSVQSIADAFGIDAEYLGRCYREEMGQSIRQSIRQKRLEYACQLLRKTNAPVQEIARLSGFSDPFYFNKVFKKVYKLTPMQFRKRQNVQ